MNARFTDNSSVFDDSLVRSAMAATALSLTHTSHDDPPQDTMYRVRVMVYMVTNQAIIQPLDSNDLSLLYTMRWRFTSLMRSSDVLIYPHSGPILAECRLHSIGLIQQAAILLWPEQTYKNHELVGIWSKLEMERCFNDFLCLL